MPITLTEPRELLVDGLDASSESAPSTTQNSFSWGWLALATLTVLVYLFTTGIIPLVGRDEPRYVQIGREMLNSGDWVTPRLGGFTWFEKPVLLYWMVAASFGVFGVNEWAARLGPALCGLGTIAAVWWMTRPVSEGWARWSALSLATSGALLSFSHGATFDIPLTVCVSLSIAGFFLSLTDKAHAKKYLAIFWAGIGLAFMAKGLVAFILVLGTVGLYALIRREKVRLGAWWGLPLALAVSAIWYGPVIAVNGEKFIHEFFVEHHFARYLSDKYKHHQPPYFYLEILPLFALPWSPWLIAGLWKSKLSNLRRDTLESKLQALAVAWMIVPIAFFSLSGSKLPGYILPAIPGAFLLVGLSLQEWAKTQGKRRFGMGLVAAVLVIVAVLTTSRFGVVRAEKSSVRSLFVKAHSRGYGGMRVICYDTTQRTAQFYAASHLIYDRAGEPLRVDGAEQVAVLAQSQPLLVLVDSENVNKLEQLPDVTIEKIDDNGKTTLVMARQRTR